MAIKLAIEDAKRRGKHRTNKETVTVALEESVQRRRQMEILDLAGKIEYYPDYDYKKGRRNRS